VPPRRMRLDACSARAYGMAAAGGRRGGMPKAGDSGTRRDDRDGRIPWAACAAVGAGGLAAVVLLGWWWGAGLFDDAYIFFRYADNVVAGAGLVYNPGERVEGFTSPAWMALLAAARLGTPRLEVVAPVLGVAAAALLAPIVWCGLWRPHGAAVDRIVNAVLALGLVCLPCVVFWAHSGMETALFAVVVTAALVAALRRVETARVSAWAAVFVAAAMLVRPEGVLLAGWVGLWATASRGRVDRAWLRTVVLPLALAAVPAVLVIVARDAYYGALVPNTYVAKVTPDTGARLLRGVHYIGRVIGGHWPLLLVVGALVAATVRAHTWPGRAASLLLGWVLLWAAYLVSVGGDHFSVYRMFLPALPALVLAIGALWQSCAAAHGRTSRAAAAFVVVLVVAFGLSIHLALRAEGGPARALPRRVAGWGAAGKWVAVNTPPDTLIAANVIGAIGYFSHRPLVDLLGLVDPVVARDGAVSAAAAPGHGRYHNDYVYARAPDLVVYPTSGQVRGRPFGWAALLPEWHYSVVAFQRDPRWAARYEHIAVPLPDGTFVEMDKKRTFPLAVDYLTAPATPGPG